MSSYFGAVHPLGRHLPYYYATATRIEQRYTGTALRALSVPSTFCPWGLLSGLVSFCLSVLWHCCGRGLPYNAFIRMLHYNTSGVGGHAQAPSLTPHWCGTVILPPPAPAPPRAASINSFLATRQSRFDAVHPPRDGQLDLG